MKKIKLYNIYLWVAIIVLIIISSISFYFVSREVISQKYISEKNYISMFLNDWKIDECKRDFSYEKKSLEKKWEEEIQKCIEYLEEHFLERRDFRYKFNIIKYGVLFVIVLSLLITHSFLYLIRKK